MQSFDEAVSQFPWIDKYRDRSVTELEFIAGLLNNPGSIPACVGFRSKVASYFTKIYCLPLNIFTLD